MILNVVFASVPCSSVTNGEFYVSDVTVYICAAYCQQLSCFCHEGSLCLSFMKPNLFQFSFKHWSWSVQIICTVM